MKKIIKNILLTFVIIYTILNLVFYTFSIISKYYMINDWLTEYTGENINVEASIEIEEAAKKFIERMRYTYGEDAPATQLAMLNNYTMGMNAIMHVQTILLVVTLILSVTIGIILSLTEKSKVKAIICFILIGLALAVLYTTYFHLTRNLPDTKFFEGFIENFMDTIRSYGIYYIIIYVLVYVGRYIIDKKKMKELNEEIEKKNK